MNRSKLISTAIAFVAIVLGFFLIKPNTSKEPVNGATSGSTPATSPSKTAEPAQQTTPQAQAKPAAQKTEIRLKDGSRSTGPRVIKTSQGELIRLTIRSEDRAAELHLHGYELVKTAAPNRPANFKFKAKLEGQFELENHETGTLVTKLVVSP